MVKLNKIATEKVTLLFYVYHFIILDHIYRQASKSTLFYDLMNFTTNVKT